MMQVSPLCLLESGVLGVPQSMKKLNFARPQLHLDNEKIRASLPSPQQQDGFKEGKLFNTSQNNEKD